MKEFFIIVFYFEVPDNLKALIKCGSPRTPFTMFYFEPSKLLFFKIGLFIQP